MEDVKTRFSFFKIIIPSCIQHRRLAIPNKFVKKFGKKLSGSVVLKVPNGREWRVELKEDEGEVWLHSGWDEFMQYHSIYVGQFLVFRYHEISKFCVVILDTSGSEIKYPCDTHDMMEPDLPLRSISNNFCGRTKKKQLETKGKKRKLSVDYEDDIVELDANGLVPILTSQKDGQQTKFAPTSDECEPDDLAQAGYGVFGSICKKVNQMCAPAARDSEEAYGKRMTYHTHQMKHKETPLVPPSSFPSKGISSNRSSMEVSMHRGAPPFREDEKGAVAPLEFTSKYPFCTIRMRHSYVCRNVNLTIPRRFARLHLQGVQEVILRVSDGRTWHVRCSSNSNVRLITGWRPFVLDNNLRVGDICIFELVDKNQREMNVTIFRVPKESSRPMPLSIKPQKNNASAFSRRKTALENEKALLAQTSFTSDYPFCTVTMRPSYLHPRFSLHLPGAFGKKYLKNGFKGITLRGLDGVIWRAHCNSQEPHMVTKGWKKFVLDNDLQVGDMCIFELVDSKNMELKVSHFSGSSLRLAA